MNPNSSISNTVMKRVRRIHTMRLLAAPTASAGLLALALWGIGREVWVAKVFENMPSFADAPGAVAFVASAFTHTDLSVQVLSIVALAALIWLARECARGLIHTHSVA